MSDEMKVLVGLVLIVVAAVSLWWVFTHVAAGPALPPTPRVTSSQ